MKLTKFHLLESTMCLYFIAGLSKSIRDINWWCVKCHLLSDVSFFVRAFQNCNLSITYPTPHPSPPAFTTHFKNTTRRTRSSKPQNSHRVHSLRLCVLEPASPRAIMDSDWDRNLWLFEQKQPRGSLRSVGVSSHRGSRYKVTPLSLMTGVSPGASIC